MAYIGRASLPANYVDFLNQTTESMMLPTPEPGYPFARMAMAGRIAEQAMAAGVESASAFVIGATGGAPVPPGLNMLMLSADMYPDAVTAVDGFGLNEGDTIKLQRPIYSTGGLTAADRELKANAAISTTGAAIKSEEVPVVLKEYHGPYLSGGSAPQPYEIKSFDAKFRANKFKLSQQVAAHLTRDYVYWIDTVIRDLFRASQYTTLTDASFTDVSDFTAGAGLTMTWEDILRAKKTLIDRHWQPFTNGRYVLMAGTQLEQDLANDGQYRELSKAHADGRNEIFGYLASIGDVDIFRASTLKQYVATDTVTGDKAGTVGTGVTLEESLLFGPGAVGLGTGQPDDGGGVGPVVRFADDSNYQTLLKVIWYATHAFATLDERGVQRIISQSA